MESEIDSPLLFNRIIGIYPKHVYSLPSSTAGRSVELTRSPAYNTTLQTKPAVEAGGNLLCTSLFANESSTR